MMMSRWVGQPLKLSGEGGSHSGERAKLGKLGDSVKNLPGLMG